MEGIEDVNLQNRDCNCDKRSTLEDGRCMYDGNCRKKMVIYDLKCLITSKSYIGKMQRSMNKQMKEAHKQYMEDHRIWEEKVWI